LKDDSSAKSTYQKRRSIICRRPILMVATVPAQAVEVREFGVVQGGRIRNLGVSIGAKDRAALATGTRP
jgi:hypothetical protein